MVPTLSVVIPAYNEAERLPAFLEQIQTYLRQADLLAYEVVVVDDGSRDHTAALVQRWAASWPELRLIQQSSNQGKGAAVRLGLRAASCDHVLYADADGATPIDQECRLRAALLAGADLAVGSRRLQVPGVVVQRHPLRGLLGGAFATVAGLVVATGVRDPQCGFKMFRRDAALRLVELCVESGYLLDLELLAQAHRLDLRVAEVGVSWSEVPGSKLNLRRELVRLAVGLLRVRRRVALTAQQIQRTSVCSAVSAAGIMHGRG